MIRIELTRGKTALVSEEDLPRVSKYKWSATMNTDKRHPSRVREKWYAVRGHRENGIQRRVYMHRFIMDAPRGLVVDHLDGDGLNNTRDNLRVVTHQENNSHLTKYKKEY